MCLLSDGNINTNCWKGVKTLPLSKEVYHILTNVFNSLIVVIHVTKMIVLSCPEIIYKISF